jgi:putative glutamine amidotransferase
MVIAGPVVGVAGQDYLARRPWGELPVVGVPIRYVDALRAAGARPVVLPPGSGADSLELLDALVLIGGGDLDPAWYGGPRDDAQDVDPHRDRCELDLAGAARAAGLPVLGACRGMQVLVVATGGSLVPHLGDHHPHRLPGAGHPVHTTPGSLVDRLVGDGNEVSSLHHQAVATLSSDWHDTAYAPDGVLEAVEWGDQAGWPALGVQWHPELDTTSAALFGWLVEVARGRRDPLPKSVGHGPRTDAAAAR